MVMDLYGRKPASHTGANVSYNHRAWHQIAEFACAIAPDLTASCEDWHANDGDGLDQDEAEELAIDIETAIASGRAAQWGIANAVACDIENQDHFITNLGTFAAFLKDCGGFEIL